MNNYGMLPYYPLKMTYETLIYCAIIGTLRSIISCENFIQYPTCTESGPNCSTFDFTYPKKKKSWANPFMYGLSFVRQFLACIG